MKILLLPVLFALLLTSCEESAPKADSREQQADSLFNQIVKGHDVAMAKSKAIEVARAKVQGAIDSLRRLPKAAQDAAAPYRAKLDSTLKDINEAWEGMDKWMAEMNWDPAKIEVEKRLQYLQLEKVKVDKVRDAILNSLQRTDKLIRNAIK